ncbi:MAG TPA: hypothetical protein VFK04_13025 [Gemmatimonadaceae bacterium]|nr:hypothetical protein [Gemmatimonadaceae bacterium]
MDFPKTDSWELAGKIGTVIVLLGSALKWLLTPMFTAAIRKALKPELKIIASASTQFAAGDQRFTAIERNMESLQSDVREIRERLDDLADRRG